VTVEPSGRVRLATGVGTQGQGHFTSFAQIVAQQLGVSPADVQVVTGDTRTFGWGTGTFASRGAVVAGSACHAAAVGVREKALALGARHLDVKESKVDIGGGRVFLRSDPSMGFTLAELAQRANPLRGAVTPGTEPGLEATKYFGPSRGSTANGVHAMIVEVDRETAEVKIRRYVVVHDCGVQINPMIVEGQIHGGVAAGIGNAFYEQLVFDDGGQLLNASLMDYLMPTALDVPTMELGHLETPSPLNPLGAKGVGEAGAIPTGALFAQAVEDALAGTGVEITEIPLSPSRLFTLMDEAKRTGPRAESRPAGRALHIEGEYDFERPPADVYATLLDPAVLMAVMHGTKRLERFGDRYVGLMEVGVGPISAAEFALDISIGEQVEGKSYAMRIDARGKLGFVGGTAKVRLEPGPMGAGTRMKYVADLQVGGTIAAVGQRLLDSVSKAMSAQALRDLAKALRARATAST
jgi:carbon monoxide dehydrogenase subunit G